MDTLRIAERNTAPIFNIRKSLGSGIIIALVFGFCYSYPAMAQVSFIGKVKTENDQPLPFANVVLLLPRDSTLVTGAMTDGDGEFSLSVQPADYMIKISMIGYQTVFSWVKIEGTKHVIHLNTFYLLEDARQLDEIVIKGQKPLIEKQTDRTVINIQSSITAAGSTALEILEKSPGVVVNRQNNSIAMSGKTGVLVMINGKVSRMPMDAVLQMLSGMSSAHIEKIELITSPPAKYDAEGNAGIIHIVMSENPDLGFNGSLSATLGYARLGKMGGSANLNNRSKRLNSFLNYSILHDQNRHRWVVGHFLTRKDFTKTNISSSNRKPLSTIQNLRAGVEYNLTQKTTVSLLVTSYRRNWDLSAVTTNLNSTAPDTTSITEMSLVEINKWQSGTGSIEISNRLTDQQEVRLGFDYLYYHNDNPSTYNNKTSRNTSSDEETEIIQVGKRTPIHFKIANIDYTNTFNDKLSMDSGIKGILSEFTNNVTVVKETQGEIKIDPELSNSSKLDEKILAAYVSWKWQPYPKWSLDGGFRYEFTRTYLTSPVEGELLDRRFGNLFPSLFVRHNFNEDNKIQLAYTKRITRPTFNDMAPFVFFIGPNTFFSGNLSLKPAISDGVDLSYQLKQWWVSLKYSYSRNEIVMFQPEFKENTNEQIFRSQNLPYVQMYGINTTFPIVISSWWEIQTDVSYYFNYYRTQHLVNNVRRQLKSFVLNMTNTIKLPKDFSIEILGYYQSASLLGIFQYKPMGKLNIGIKKKFKNDAALSLSVSDAFNTAIWDLKTDDTETDSRSSFYYDWGTRSINLTYSFNFGNRKLKAVNINSSSETERKRVQ